MISRKLTSWQFLLTAGIVAHLACGRPPREDSAAPPQVTQNTKDTKDTQNKVESSPKNSDKSEQHAPVKEIAPEQAIKLGYPSFLDYCKDANAEASIKHTVAVLKSKVGDGNCETTSQRLAAKESLFLSHEKLVDLRPLAGFTQLKRISLRDNAVADLRPLTAMQNLEYLAVSGNQIYELGPVSSLGSLKILLIANNPAQLTEDLATSLAYVASGKGDPELERVSDTLDAEVNASQNEKVNWRYGEGICFGGWNYQAYLACQHPSHGVLSYNLGRTAACGVESTNKVNNSCRHESNGVERWKEKTEEKTFKLEGVKRSITEKIPVKTGINWVDRVITKVVIDPIPDLPTRPGDLIRKCFSWSEGLKTPKTSISVNHSLVVNNPFKIELLCKVKVKVPDLYYNKPNAACGVNETTVHKQCRHAAHGVEAYQYHASAECGLSDRIARGPLKQSADSVKKLFGIPKDCTSCDDIATDTGDGIAKKINCLARAFKDKINSAEAKARLSHFKFNHIDRLTESQFDNIEAILNN